MISEVLPSLKTLQFNYSVYVSYVIRVMIEAHRANGPLAQLCQCQPL